MKKLLEVAWEALIDSGLDIWALHGSERVGVYCGSCGAEVSIHGPSKLPCLTLPDEHALPELLSPSPYLERSRTLAPLNCVQFTVCIASRSTVAYSIALSINSLCRPPK